MASDKPIRLTDHIFTSAELCRISGLADSQLRNWVARKVLPPIGARFGGRFMFSLLDVLRVAAMADLTGRVLMPPGDAVKVAELVVRQAEAHAADGLADVNTIPRTLSLAVAWLDGEPHVQLVDPKQPGGYADWQGQWGRAHVVLPLSGLLANVLWQAITVLAARESEVA